MERRGLLPFFNSCLMFDVCFDPLLFLIAHSPPALRTVKHPARQAAETRATLPLPARQSTSTGKMQVCSAVHQIPKKCMHSPQVQVQRFQYRVGRKNQRAKCLAISSTRRTKTRKRKVPLRRTPLLHRQPPLGVKPSPPVPQQHRAVASILRAIFSTRRRQWIRKRKIRKTRNPKAPLQPRWLRKRRLMHPCRAQVAQQPPVLRLALAVVSS